MSASQTLVLLALVGAALGGLPRSNQEIEDYRRFLETSQQGEYEEPLTPELGRLQNAWERSGKYQGDILLTDEQKQDLLEEYMGGKNVLLNKKALWPNKTLFYNISEEYFEEEDLEALNNAIALLQSVSCVILKQRGPDDRNWVQVKGFAGGCSSYIGMVGKSQTMNLNPYNCLSVGTIMHEFLHALGFYHQHAASERDDYVNVIWEKIQAGKSGNFNKESNKTVTNYGIQYDYGSVMHYSRYAFSKDGNATLIMLKPYVGPIGQRDFMSPSDIKKLNILYQCPGFEEHFHG